MPAPAAQRDYFAELYSAGIFGDSGWSVDFPKRDVGFDFVATKEVDGKVILRPAMETLPVARIRIPCVFQVVRRLQH